MYRGEIRMRIYVLLSEQRTPTPEEGHMASKNYKRSKSVSLEEETIQKLQVRANRHAGNGHGIWSK